MLIKYHSENNNLKYRSILRHYKIHLLTHFLLGFISLCLSPFSPFSLIPSFLPCNHPMLALLVFKNQYFISIIGLSRVLFRQINIWEWCFKALLRFVFSLFVNHFLAGLFPNCTFFRSDTRRLTFLGWARYVFLLLTYWTCSFPWDFFRVFYRWVIYLRLPWEWFSKILSVKITMQMEENRCFLQNSC